MTRRSLAYMMLKNQESEHISQNDESNFKHDIDLTRLFKLGVAVAVIRSKPPNRSAKEHTQYLLSLFTVSEQKWQQKYQTAQAEILNLKQRIFLANGSQALDSAGDSQPLFPTPSSSSEDTNIDPSTRKQETLHHDVLYLQCVTQLQQVEEDVKSGSSSSLGQLTKSTMEHSLQCVKTVVSDIGQPFAPTLLAGAITNVIRVLDCQSTDQWAQRCYNMLRDILFCLVQRLLAIDKFEHSSELSRLQVLELLSCFYQTSSEILLQTVIGVFVGYVQQFCSHLHQTCDPTLGFCPVMAENIVDVIDMLETCTHRNKRLLCVSAGHRICFQLQEQLETCLLHLTHFYPLLAHAVWRITSLLELCQTDIG